MATTICPGCKVPLDIMPQMAGQQVACPRCRTTFAAPVPQMMAMPPAPPPPAPSYTAAEKTAAPELMPLTSRTRPEQPATLWDIFDLSFSRYVTPLIVKITWVLTLFFTSAWLLIIFTVLLIDLMPDTPVRSSPRPSMQFELADKIDYAWWRGLVRLIVLATQITGALLFVLGMRVVLESVMVVFNMAASLRSIDRKTKTS